MPRRSVRRLAGDDPVGASHADVAVVSWTFARLIRRRFPLAERKRRRPDFHSASGHVISGCATPFHVTSDDATFGHVISGRTSSALATSGDATFGHVISGRRLLPASELSFLLHAQ